MRAPISSGNPLVCWRLGALGGLIFRAERLESPPPPEKPVPAERRGLARRDFLVAGAVDPRAVVYA